MEYGEFFIGGGFYMPYRYLNASLPMQKTPKDSLTGDFQGALNRDFKVSSDWFTIQREYPYGSEQYEDIDVRINRVFDGKTTVTISDDFKKILFKNPDDAPLLGGMYKFDNNYWIVTNVEAIKSLATACVVRRCNNVLRWKDYDTGFVYSKPCIIEYLIKETRDYTTGGSSLVQPSGFAEIIVQFSEATNKIRPSRRFLFGNKNNWMAYKVMGGGVNNFDNRITKDMMSVGLLRLSTLANQANEQNDDFINGVADSMEYNYSLSLNENSASITIGSSYILIPTTTLNGEEISRDVTWTSSDITKAVVNSLGVVTPISSGNVVIRCSLSNNESAFDECSISITEYSVDNYSIDVSPNVDYVYEGAEQVFTTVLYLNGLAQANTFTYSLSVNGISYNNFQYNVLSGNTFWIKNMKKHIGANLVITATSGVHSIQIPVSLKGAW